MRAWIVPALVTFVFWGLYGFFPKLTTKYINPSSAILYGSLVGLPIAIFIFIVLRGQIESDPRGIGLAVVTGIVGIIGAFGFIVAASRGPVSLVVAFTALYPTVTILLATLFLGEVLEPRQWAGVGLALVAMLLIAI